MPRVYVSSHTQGLIKPSQLSIRHRKIALHGGNVDFSARTYAVAPGAFGAPGPPAAAPPPPQGGSFGGLFAGGTQAVPPKMPRGSATTAPPRDYGSGFSSTYSAFGGGGLGLFASAPGFITTTPRVVDDSSSAPGAPGDTTRRPSP